MIVVMKHIQPHPAKGRGTELLADAKFSMAGRFKVDFHVLKEGSRIRAA